MAGLVIVSYRCIKVDMDVKKWVCEASSIEGEEEGSAAMTSYLPI